MYLYQLSKNTDSSSCCTYWNKRLGGLRNWGYIVSPLILMLHLINISHVLNLINYFNAQYLQWLIIDPKWSALQTFSTKFQVSVLELTYMIDFNSVVDRFIVPFANSHPIGWTKPLMFWMLPPHNFQPLVSLVRFLLNSLRMTPTVILFVHGSFLYWQNYRINSLVITSDSYSRKEYEIGKVSSSILFSNVLWNLVDLWLHLSFHLRKQKSCIDLRSCSQYLYQLQLSCREQIIALDHTVLFFADALILLIFLQLQSLKFIWYRQNICKR